MLLFYIIKEKYVGLTEIKIYGLSQNLAGPDSSLADNLFIFILFLNCVSASI